MLSFLLFLFRRAVNVFIDRDQKRLFYSTPFRRMKQSLYLAGQQPGHKYLLSSAFSDDVRIFLLLAKF